MRRRFIRSAGIAGLIGLLKCGFDDVRLDPLLSQLGLDETFATGTESVVTSNWET